jgi:hypothetical protein
MTDREIQRIIARLNNVQPPRSLNHYRENLVKQGGGKRRDPRWFERE